MNLAVRFHKRRPWFVNVDLYFVRFQWCNGYWFGGFTTGGKHCVHWSGHPK